MGSRNGTVKQIGQHRIRLSDCDIDLIIRMSLPTLMSWIREKRDIKVLERATNILKRLHRAERGRPWRDWTYDWGEETRHSQIERYVKSRFEDYFA